MARILFFGTHVFAKSILERLVADKIHAVVAVYTQPPQPVGRGWQLSPSPVQLWAAAQNIPVFSPKTLRDEIVQKEITSLGAEMFLVAQYGKIIPAAILAIPPKGVMNIHTSLLPRHRGATPIQSALLSGDTETGVTFMKMDELLDHGPILEQLTTPISSIDTAETLQERLINLAADNVSAVIQRLVAGELTPKPQDESLVTICKQMERENGYVVWEEKTAAEVERMIRAYTPWPGVTTQAGNLLIKIHKARVSAETDSPSASPGTLVINGSLVKIKARDKFLIIDELQVSGKPRMAAAAFANGYKNFNGRIFTPPPNRASVQ